MQIPEALKAEILRCLAGLTEDEKLLALGKLVREDIVQAMISQRPVETQYHFTDLTGSASRSHTETPAAALTDEERREIPELQARYFRGQLDRAGQDRLLALLDRSLPEHARESFQAERARRTARNAESGAPVPITDAQAVALKAVGHDPEMLRRAGEIHSVEDYRRMKREIERARG